MAKKLLIITQKVDEKDSALGFFHGWLKVFKKSGLAFDVICLEKGVVNLPQEISVFSLGKEKGDSKMKYIFNFYWYIFQKRKNYDAVFVHMNPEYIVLAGLFWKLSGKKIVFWYNHTFGNWRTRVAILFADVVCHTSPFAFSAGRKKSRRMPAGINTEVFSRVGKPSDIPSILYIGRIAPVKDVITLIRAVKILESQKIPFSLDIYGESLPRDTHYFDKVKKEADELTCQGMITFHGSIPNIETPPIFSRSWIFVNLTPLGNYDKTVIEACACGSIPLVSSKAFADMLPKELIFNEKDSLDLSNKIKTIFSKSQLVRDKLGEEMRKLTIERHSLEKLSKEIFSIFSSF